MLPDSDDDITIGKMVWMGVLMLIVQLAIWLGALAAIAYAIVWVWNHLHH